MYLAEILYIEFLNVNVLFIEKERNIGPLSPEASRVLERLIKLGKRNGMYHVSR